MTIAPVSHSPIVFPPLAHRQAFSPSNPSKPAPVVSLRFAATQALPPLRQVPEDEKLSRMQNGLDPQTARTLLRLAEAPATPQLLKNQLYRVLYPRERGVLIFTGTRPQGRDVETAYRLGQLLARQRYFPVSGGGPGGMAAVSRGSVEAGGHAAGIWLYIPNEKPDLRVYPERITLPNFPLRMYGENGYEHRSTDTIVLPGGLGTVREALNKFEDLAYDATPFKARKRLILLDTDGFFTRPNSLVPLLRQLAENNRMSRPFLDMLRIAQTPEEAVAILNDPDDRAGWAPGGENLHIRPVQREDEFYAAGALTGAAE